MHALKIYVPHAVKCQRALANSNSAILKRSPWGKYVEQTNSFM